MSVDELKALGIDVRRAEKREDRLGGGVIYEFWLAVPALKQYLPMAGEWAANTSVAWVKSTDELGTLDVNGWKWD